MTDQEREKLERERKEKERVIEQRNKEAQQRIRDHDEIKKSSRAYQEGGAFYNFNG